MARSEIGSYTDAPPGTGAVQSAHVHNDRVPEMIRPSPWPELDRLARFVRASDSLTDTLALWTGRGLTVEILRQVDDACPDPLVAGARVLHDGARVQDRSVLMRCGDLVVAAARSLVATDSPALTPTIRKELQAGSGLGELVRPLHHRRVAVRVTALGERPTGDPTAPVLAVQARLDVAGTPVGWCEETVYEAVLAQDGRPARRRPLRIAA
jgi:chorismate-pyruvate lyase